MPARSSVRFKNKTFWGLATVTGEFTEVRGAGQVTANGAVSGELVIGAASLKTGIGKRDEHLRSADFFDVENHPVIRVEVTGAGAHRRDRHLRATLTVRGTTEPLPLPVTVKPAGRRHRAPDGAGDDRPHETGCQRQYGRHDAGDHHAAGRRRLCQGRIEPAERARRQAFSQ